MGFLKGLIFGGIVGGVATALLNPRTGQENQQMLKEMAKEITDEIELAQENLENFNTSKDEVLYHVENSLKPAIEGISQAL
ncbi:MAG: YtxH domain-containing protein, partial [Streptococcaceae bacterium]|nr:YtxH domain-containing protein [Streptococcaceae bacterium]